MLRLDKSGMLHDKSKCGDFIKRCYRNENRYCGVSCTFCCLISKEDADNIRNEDGIVFKCMSDNTCYFRVEIDEKNSKRGKDYEKGEQRED